jgi:DNA-binding transcriptional ArsR family regulator
MKMSDAVEALGALAQENRLGIVRYLIERGPRGAAAGQVREALGLHAATLSFHLTTLRQAGLVVSRRASRSIIYSVDYDRVSALVNYLLQNCCAAVDPLARTPSRRLETAIS